MKPKLKMPYDNHEQESDATGLECKDPSLTQQHDEPEANINNIVRRFTQTGELPVRALPPMQGDFSNAPDMQTALNLMVAAKDAFMQQPADVRARFDNDPARYVDFCSNPDNAPELEKLGLLSEDAMATRLAARTAAANQAAADKADAETYRKEQKDRKLKS